MKLSSILPWLCVLGSLLAAVWMYVANQKQEADLLVLRGDNQQLQKLRADLEEASAARAKAANEEMGRLRKDNEELLRLRNEVRQLRGDKQQLNTQLQTAQTQVQGVQAQVEALRANPGQPATAAQPNPAAQPRVVPAAGPPPANLEQANLAACINNLRMIDGAKQQWALEKQKPGGALLTAADLAPYLRSNTVPVCPAGGVYTLNPVSVPPICNIPGHTLTR